MTISIIAAIGENRELGYKGKVPWHIREDLINFRDKTIGHVVIMGRKTFDSILAYYKKSPNPIPKRTHIVITRNKDYKVNIPNAYVVHSIKEAIQLAKEKSSFAKASEDEGEIFISGGGQIYKQTIELTDKLYLTIVKGNYKADTYFPEYSQFKKVLKEEEKESEGYKYKFLELER